MTLSDTPKVSVLIPCYNAERYIAETMTAVLAQTWRNIEVVVVDDGSSDASFQIISDFAGPNVRIYRQSNRGQTAALNVCLTHSSGDFIQYLDSDDIIDPDKIELQVRRLLNNTDFVASAEWGRFINSPAETRWNPEPLWRDLEPIDWLALSGSEGLGMMFPALWLIPRKIAQRAGPWNETLTLNNDAEYFTRVLLAARGVLFCEGARCRYRSGDPRSLSARKSQEGWISQWTVLDLCETYVRAREDSDRVRRGFALSWQHFAHSAYPYDRAIAERALKRASALHPVSIRPGGGQMFELASKLLGWRMARRLQVASGRQ